MDGYTGDFALVCEGITDHAVLRNVLLGYFKGQQREPFLHLAQPDKDATADDSWQQFGNWEFVFRYLRARKHRDALQFNRFLIVQIDTDCCEHPNFDVSEREKGKLLTPEQLVDRVAAKLRDLVGQEDCAAYGDRLIFAICVRSIECWLLPLWETGGKAAKTTGCMEVLNDALRRGNRPIIPPDGKKVALYETASRGYRKRATLHEEGVKNSSLAVFLAELNRRGIVLASSD